MPSTDVRAGEPKPTDKEYTEIIKSSTVVDKKFVNETGQAAKIIYFCRDCQKITTPKRIGKKFKFACSICSKENVAFGSEQSIRNYYRLPTGDGPAKK
jgi:predicted SprT family Zn-dependent metalloprotease